jgi:hypothetical protein
MLSGYLALLRENPAVPRKPALRRTPTSSYVGTDDGILRHIPPDRVAELAENYNLDHEELTRLVERVRPGWALDERRWRTAFDPALPRFQAAAARLLAAWQALPLATQSAIFQTVEYLHRELAGQRQNLEVLLASLPEAMEFPHFWRSLPEGPARGLPPHTRATIRELAAFWREQTRGSAMPRWSEQLGTTIPMNGSRFVIELMADVTALSITPDQLRDVLRAKGARVPAST